MLKTISLLVTGLFFSVNVYAESINIDEYKQMFKSKLDEHNINLNSFNKFSPEEAKQWLLKLQQLAKNAIDTKQFTKDKENSENNNVSIDSNENSMNLSLPQKEMFKKIYLHLKAKPIEDPELKKIMNKTIELIEKSGVFK